MRRIFIAALMAAGTAVSTLHAQAPRGTDLQPGTRIRVAAPVRANGIVVTATRGWTVGTVQSVDSQAVVLRVRRPEGEVEEQIPFDIMTDLEVSRGIGTVAGARRRGAVRGGLIGAGVGAVVSGFAYLANRGDEEFEDREPAECSGLCSLFESTTANTARNIGVGGAAGALIGGVIGGRAREIWEPTRMPRVDFVAGAGGRTTLSFSLAL
jgi:hypothetical protein